MVEQAEELSEGINSTLFEEIGFSFYLLFVVFLFCSEVTPANVQGLLLAFCSGISLQVVLRGQYGMLRIKTRSATLEGKLPTHCAIALGLVFLCISHVFIWRRQLNWGFF